MWRLFKKRRQGSKLVVYRPQLLDPSISVRILATQPPQTRLFVRYAGELLIISLLGLATAWIVRAAYVSPGSLPYLASYETPTTPVFSQLASHSTWGTYLNVALLPKSASPFLRPNNIANKTPPVAGIPQTLQPVNYPGAACTTTVMNIVAHEDDDLLFINPAVAHDIARHKCVRTIYVTAGDDGRGFDYLHLREQGSEAAYSTMLHTASPWIYQPLTLPSGTVVASAHPEGENTVSLIFLRLPDGNVDGSGFEATGAQSLARLKSGGISAIRTVDGRTTYTSSEFISVLEQLMQLYQPAHINTQADDSGMPVADHSDHVATGQYVADAVRRYSAISRAAIGELVRYYMGYPIRNLPANLSTSDINQKSAAFFAYAPDDTGVCTSLLDCEVNASTYGSYLSRQYTQN